MKESFYPVPPSFGALMKRQGTERNFVEEVQTLDSYQEMERRLGKKITGHETIAKLLVAKALPDYPAMKHTLTFRQFVEALAADAIVGRVSVEDSIAQNIRLYLSSRPGEYFFDPSYGCIVHGYSFRQLSESSIQGQLKQSVTVFLEKFEKRIVVHDLSITINDVQESAEGRSQTICRYIILTLNASLANTRQQLKEMKFKLVRYI